MGCQGGVSRLLCEDLGLKACPRNPDRPGFASYGPEPQSELRLSQWMTEFLTLAIWPKLPNAGEPRILEAAVIRELQPSLNLTHVATPWTATVNNSGCAQPVRLVRGLGTPAECS